MHAVPDVSEFLDTENEELEAHRKQIMANVALPIAIESLDEWDAHKMLVVVETLLVVVAALPVRGMSPARSPLEDACS